jgi:uncharacterized cupin superfamily protein
VTDYGHNVWGELEDLGGGVRGRRLVRTEGSQLVAAVWELDPGAEPGPYHLHHGTEEYLLILRGRPTLRTPQGERELVEGDVAHFPRGLDGAHQVLNRSDGVVRFLMAAAHDTPEVIEYPDRGLIIAASRAPSAGGDSLFAAFRMADAVDPAERDPPRAEG